MLKRILLVTSIFVCGGVSTQAQTAAVKKQILNRVIQLGEITREEVKERGGVSRILSIQSVDLNRDGKPEYIAVSERVKQQHRCYRSRHSNKPTP